ncbi:MAG: phosphotransferase [Candidatus Omnitrophota bacterium]
MKFTAFIVVFVFTMTSVTWTTPATAEPAAAIPAACSMDSLAIPPEMGTITSKYQAGGQEFGEKDGLRTPNSALRTVILIQDAHTVVNAQENIAKILDHLQKSYSIRLTVLEGARSKLDPTIFRAFPAIDIKQKVLSGYLKRGEITGVQMASIFSEKEHSYYGIEDWNLYEENYRAYLRAQEARRVLEAKWKAFKTHLDETRKTVYSEKMNEFQDRWEDFRAERTNLAEFLMYLVNFKKILARDKGLPELNKLVDSVGYTVSGDQKKLVPVIKTMAAEFKAKYVRGMDVKSEMNFYNRYQAFLTGQMESGQFLQYMIELGHARGFRPKLTPAIRRLLGHTETLSAIKGSQLFAELQKGQETIEASLMTKPEEKELAVKYRRLFLLQELLSLELTHETLSQYQADPEAYLDLLGDAAFKEGLAPAVEFYKLALERDLAFYKNLTARMEDQKQSMAVVVAGGFHTNGLQRILEEQKISYAVVSPRMASLAGSENYDKVMHNDLSYKEFLKTTYYDAFVRDATQRLVKEMNQPDFVRNLKLWRDDVIRDLSDQGRITEAGNYTRYLDALAQVYVSKFGNGPARNKEEILKTLSKELNDFRDKSLGQLWQHFESQLDSFINGLKGLVQRSELNPQNVSALADGLDKAKPSALIPPVVLDPKTSPVSLPIAEVKEAAAVEETAKKPALSEAATTIPMSSQPVARVDPALKVWLNDFQNRLRSIIHWMRFDNLNKRGVPKFVLYPNLDLAYQMVRDELSGLIRSGDRILEMGVGSGVITELLAEAVRVRNIRDVRLTGIDIDPDAVKISREVLKPFSNVEVRQGDLFGPVHQGEKFDIIFWNPPWFSGQWWKENYGPQMVDADYQTILRFLQQTRDHLKPGGRIYLLFPVKYFNKIQGNIPYAFSMRNSYQNGSRLEIGLFEYDPMASRRPGFSETPKLKKDVSSVPRRMEMVEEEGPGRSVASRAVEKRELRELAAKLALYGLMGTAESYSRSEARFQIPAEAIPEKAVVDRHDVLGDVVDAKEFNFDKDQWEKLFADLHRQEEEIFGTRVRNEWKHWFTTSRYRIYVLVRDHQITGAIVGENSPDDKTVRIGPLMSREDPFQGKGQFLMDCFLSRMLHEGRLKIIWTTSKRAQKFYDDYIASRKRAGILKKITKQPFLDITTNFSLDYEIRPISDPLDSTKYDQFRESWSVHRDQPELSSELVLVGRSEVRAGSVDSWREKLRPSVAADKDRFSLSQKADYRSYLARHRAQWNAIKDAMMDYLAQRARTQATEPGEKPVLTLVSFGPSTGEELARNFYRISMKLRAQGQDPDQWDIRIVGVEKDKNVIEEAWARIQGRKPFVYGSSDADKEALEYGQKIINYINEHFESWKASVRLVNADANDRDVYKAATEGADLVFVNHLLRNFGNLESERLLGTFEVLYPNSFLLIGDLPNLEKNLTDGLPSYLVENKGQATDAENAAKTPENRTAYFVASPKEYIDVATQSPGVRSEARGQQPDQAMADGRRIERLEQHLFQVSGQEVTKLQVSEYVGPEFQDQVNRGIQPVLAQGGVIAVDLSRLAAVNGRLDRFIPAMNLLAEIVRKVLEEANPDLPDGNYRIPYVFQELFKNAFYHGNGMEFVLPVYLKVEAADRKIMVYDFGKGTPQEEELQSEATRTWGISGGGVGVGNVQDLGWDYFEPADVMGFAGEVVGKVTSVHLSNQVRAGNVGVAPETSSQEPTGEEGGRSEVRWEISDEDLAAREATLGKVAAKMREEEGFWFGHKFGKVDGNTTGLDLEGARDRIVSALSWESRSFEVLPLKNDEMRRAAIEAMNEALCLIEITTSGITIDAKAQALYQRLAGLPSQDQAAILTEIKKFQDEQALPKAEPQPLGKDFKEEVRIMFANWDSLPVKSKLEIDGRRYVDLGDPEIQIPLKRVSNIVQEPDRVFTRYTDEELLREAGSRFDETVVGGRGYQLRDMVTLEKDEVQIVLVKEKKNGPGFEVQPFLLDTADLGLVWTILTQRHRYSEAIINEIAAKAWVAYENVRGSHDDAIPSNFRIKAFMGAEGLAVEIIPIDLGEVGRQTWYRSEARGEIPSEEQIDKNLLEGILADFGIAQFKAVPVEDKPNVLIIEGTEKGDFVLKRPKFRNMPSTIEWEASVLDRLLREQRIRVAGIQKAQDGKTYVKVGDGYFVLYEKLEGKNDYGWGDVDGEQLIAAAKVLAQIHQTLKDFKPTQQNYSQEDLPQVFPVNDVEHGLTKLEALHDEIQALQDTDRIFLEQWEKINLWVKKLREKLEAASLRDLPETIVQGDFQQSNMFFQDDGGIALTDFEYAHRDKRVFDLANALVLRFRDRDPSDRSSLDMDKIERFVGAYDDALPAGEKLTSKEIELLPYVYALGYLERVHMFAGMVREKNMTGPLLEQLANLDVLANGGIEAMSKRLQSRLARSETRRSEAREKVERFANKVGELVDVNPGQVFAEVMAKGVEAVRSELRKQGQAELQRIEKEYNEGAKSFLEKAGEKDDVVGFVVTTECVELLKEQGQFGGLAQILDIQELYEGMLNAVVMPVAFAKEGKLVRYDRAKLGDLERQLVLANNALVAELHGVPISILMNHSQYDAKYILEAIAAMDIRQLAVLYDGSSGLGQAYRAVTKRFTPLNYRRKEVNRLASAVVSQDGSELWFWISTKDIGIHTRDLRTLGCNSNLEASELADPLSKKVVTLVLQHALYRYMTLSRSEQQAVANNPVLLKNYLKDIPLPFLDFAEEGLSINISTFVTQFQARESIERAA